MKSGNLNFLEPSGPLQACNGTALPLPLPCKVSFFCKDGKNEQKFAIKFCIKAGLSATETLVLVQKSYGKEDLNRSNFVGGILDFETEGNW